MESIITYIIIGIVAVFVIGIAISLFVAILPYLIGGAAILFVLAIIGFITSNFISNSSSPHAIQYSTSQQHATQAPAEPTYHKRNEAQTQFHEAAIAQVYQKSGVNLTTLQPALDSALFTITAAFEYVMGEYYTPTVTSGDDYEGHCDGSAHYSGAALDFRLKDIDDPDIREMVTVAVRESLGDRFFVDHEAPGQENEHLHVQLRKGTYSKVAWR